MNNLHDKLDKVMGEQSTMQEQVNTLESKVNELYDVQTVGTVSKTELDTAYREGVNSIE